MLVDPKDMAAGPKGYIKCNITVNVKGQKLKSHPESDGEEDIEGYDFRHSAYPDFRTSSQTIRFPSIDRNLLLPIEGIGNRRRARFVFTIYRADGLPGMDGFFRCKSQTDRINPYIQISFSATKVIEFLYLFEFWCKLRVCQ